MPIEIRELVIRAVIASDQDDEDSGSNTLVSTGGSNQDALVQECVRQVLRILRKERER